MDLAFLFGSMRRFKVGRWSRSRTKLRSSRNSKPCLYFEESIEMWIGARSCLNLGTNSPVRTIDYHDTSELVHAPRSVETVAVLSSWNHRTASMTERPKPTPVF